MNRRDVMINAVKLVGLGLLAPTLAKASEHFGDLVPAADRTATLVETLETVVGKAYPDITHEDLVKLETLTLEHIHVAAFVENDFAGLDNLKFLNITSIFHTMPGVIAKEVFAPLRKLETLELTFNQFSNKLSPDVFVYLTALKTLDISSSRFVLFPESVFTSLPRLETLIVSNSLNPQLLERLKAHFGGRLVIK